MIYYVKLGILEEKSYNLFIPLAFFCFTLASYVCDPSQVLAAPGDHGDHGTSVSDEIDQKTKVDKNTWFFLRFFYWVGGWTL